MENIELLAVIRYLHLQGKSAETIHEEMYDKECSSYEGAKRWKREFKCGRTILQDDPRQGRPSTATELRVMAKVEHLVLENRRVTVDLLVREINVSMRSAYNILHGILCISKIGSQVVDTFSNTVTRGRCTAKHSGPIPRRWVGLFTHISDHG